MPTPPSSSREKPHQLSIWEPLLPAVDRESDKGSLEISTGISSAVEFPGQLRKRATHAVSPISCLASQIMQDKTSTPILDSTTAYLYQDDNAVPPPDDPVRTTHCIHCLNARDTTGYHERVASLMSRLWRSSCQAEHPAVQFSLASRKTNASSRLCISCCLYCAVVLGESIFYETWFSFHY